ncbi:MAG: sporulation protein YabP [Ruminococcus sp.]|nr:sporulation protein YabP [Ruminococcus sp.]
MSETRENARPHTLVLNNQKALSLTGIAEVAGFDDQTVNLRTDTCSLTVKGESLHINKLDLESGDVCIDGEIRSLQYLGARPKSLKSKLLR